MSERTEVQDPLIRYAAEIGWQYIAQDDALTLRGSETRQVIMKSMIDTLPN